MRDSTIKILVSLSAVFSRSYFVISKQKLNKTYKISPRPLFAPVLPEDRARGKLQEAFSSGGAALRQNFQNDFINSKHFEGYKSWSYRSKRFERVLRTGNSRLPKMDRFLRILYGILAVDRKSVV